MTADEHRRRRAMTDGGESDEFPVGMVLRTASGVSLAYLSAIGGATIIGTGPSAGIVGMAIMGAGMMASVWLIGTARRGDGE